MQDSLATVKDKMQEGTRVKLSQHTDESEKLNFCSYDSKRVNTFLKKVQERPDKHTLVSGNVWDT